MAKTGNGDIAGAGRREGEFVRWDEGLTQSDKEHLQVVADNTDKIIREINNAVIRGLEAIGIEAESDAAAICPVDTGRLRNSITHTLSNDGKAAIIGTNIEYAEYVHNGTHNHKAQPFLTDAINQNADKYRRILKASMSG